MDVVSARDYVRRRREMEARGELGGTLAADGDGEEEGRPRSADSGLAEPAPVEEEENVPVDSAGGSDVPRLDLTALTPSPRRRQQQQSHDAVAQSGNAHVDCAYDVLLVADAGTQTLAKLLSDKSVQTAAGRKRPTAAAAARPDRSASIVGGRPYGRKRDSAAHGAPCKLLPHRNYLRLRESNPELNVTPRPFAAYGVGSAAYNMATGNACEFNAKAQIRRAGAHVFPAQPARREQRNGCCCCTSAAAAPRGPKGRVKGRDLFETSKDNPMIFK